MTSLGNPSVHADAAELFSWPLANDYDFEISDVIRPLGSYKGLTSTPLQDPDLFGAFARLWADGEPSESRIKRWVGRHGLFSAEEVMQPLHERGIVAFGVSPFDPLPLKEFLEESRQAHDALTLYEAIRNKRSRVMRSYIRRERINPPKGPPGRFANTYVRFGDAWVDAANVVLADEGLDKQTLLGVSEAGIMRLLSSRLDGQTHLRFGRNFGHKRPLARAARPVLVFVPKDLKAAIWYQFAEEMTDARSWKICDGCDQPFPVRRTGQECCAGSPSCRKRKERKKKAAT